MKYLRFLIIVILALALSFADAAYFSFIEISGITLVTSYLVANTVAMTGKFSDLVALCYAFVIFFSVFSSLPVWVLFVLFFALPLTFYQLKSSYFPELSVLASFFFFIATSSIFEMVLLFEAKEWNKNSLELIGYFALYNSLAGMAIYHGAKKVRRYFVRGEIKI